ncbi:MAG: hypothetical protein K8W52_20430 [Deltaproteobacteria bacterium]|nr:hypothetical protein [Deltaproteobacteria bacterium]
MAPPHDLEHVAAAAVTIGDLVYLVPPTAHVSPHCVVAKASMRVSARAAGWRVELADGGTAWWPQGARVWRRRARPGGELP